MDTTAAIAVLENALERCRKEDMRTPDVFAALDFVAARASVQWPFDQFRESLNSTGSELWGNRRPVADLECLIEWDSVGHHRRLSHDETILFLTILGYRGSALWPKVDCP